MPYRYDVVESNIRQADHPEIGILASVDLPDPSKPWWQQVPFRLPLVKDDLQPGPSWYEERLSRGIPEAGPTFVSVSRIDSDPDGTPVYHLTIEDPAFYNKPTPKKKGFLGGASGGLLGGILAVALAPTGATPFALAAFAAAGAAGGTLIGSGTEAAITGGKFELGSELTGAGIAGGVAAVGVGVTSALGPATQATTQVAAGTAQEAAGQAIVNAALQSGEAGGFIANVTQEALGAAIVEGSYGLTASVTQPGLVSSGTAKALGGVASTVTKTALSPFVPMDASLGSQVIPTTPIRTAPVPLSGGAVNTTGASWFNYGNTVDIPVAQPVGLFDTVLDSILPPFMHPDDLGRVDTPGDTRRDYSAASDNQAGLIVAAIIIIGSAAAFAHARR